MSDSVEKLREAVENQLDWLQRMKYMLRTADLTTQDKFLDGVTRSVKRQTDVTKSTCRNLQQFEKSLPLPFSG